MKSVELFDALDKSGRLTGQRKTRKQILDDGDWRKVVHVWIVDSQSRLLTQQRAVKGMWDNLWDVSVGGGVSADENPAEAAARELNEELGIKATSDDLANLAVWDTSKPLPETGQTAHEFSHTFLLRRDVEVEDLKLEPREVVAVKKIPLQDLKQVFQGPEYDQWVPHPSKYYLGVLALIKARND